MKMVPGVDIKNLFLAQTYSLVFCKVDILTNWLSSPKRVGAFTSKKF